MPLQYPKISLNIVKKNSRNTKIPNHPKRAKKALEQSLFGVFDGGCQLF